MKDNHLISPKVKWYGNRYYFFHIWDADEVFTLPAPVVYKHLNNEYYVSSVFKKLSTDALKNTYLILSLITLNVHFRFFFLNGGKKMNLTL